MKTCNTCGESRYIIQYESRSVCAVCNNAAKYYEGVDRGRNCTVTLEQLRTLFKAPCEVCQKVPDGDRGRISLRNRRGDFEIPNIYPTCEEHHLPALPPLKEAFDEDGARTCSKHGVLPLNAWRKITTKDKNRAGETFTRTVWRCKKCRAEIDAVNYQKKKASK